MATSNCGEISDHQWSWDRATQSVPTLEPKSGLWSPAIVLPVQLYQRPKYAEAHRGEIALMHAVLADAVACFQHQASFSHGHPGQLAKEASQWIFTDDVEWPFSFVNICTVLGLEPEHIRHGLRRWRQQHVDDDRTPTTEGAVPPSHRRAAA